MSCILAGGSGPLKSPLPTKLLLSWEDIQADHLDVPAVSFFIVWPGASLYCLVAVCVRL